MIRFPWWAIMVMAVLPGASPAAAADVVLAPNAKLSFEFPDLPQTYHARQTGEKIPATLGAQLPENYSATGKFPVFVYLAGGSGAKVGDPSMARTIVGPRDFITVGLPLFMTGSGSGVVSLEGLPPELVKRAKGIEYLTSNDFSVTARAYQTMLSKLFEAVPNTTPERSTFGGMSNGAHCTGALLAIQNDFLLDHFTAFYFLDGGHALLFKADALKDPRAKRSRYLFLRGDPEKDESAARKVLEPLVLLFELRTKADGVDFMSIMMRGYGHEQPPEYLNLLGAWTRGEKLPEIEGK